MSEVTLEELINEGLKRQFRFTVPAKRTHARVEELIKEKGKTYKEPGFRPGKVPFERLKAIFEESVLEKAVSQIIQQASSEFLKERTFNLAFKPEYALESYEPDQGIVYTLSFELKPDVPEVSDEGLTLERAKLSVSDAEVDAYVKEWASSLKDSKPISEERPTQKDDYVKVRMVLTAAKGQPEEDEQYFSLNETDLRPEILDALLGKKIGEKIHTPITFPKNMKDRKVAGKTVQAEFEILEILEQFPFEPSDAFAHAVKMKDLNEVKERAKSILEKQGEHLAFLWIKRQILDFFARKYLFDVPSKMVDLEYKSIWNQTFQELGIPEKAPENDDEATQKRAELFEKEVGKREEELADFYRKAAERRVRLGFLLTKLGQKLGVELTNEEKQGAFFSEIKKYPGEEKHVIKFYSENPEAMSRLYAPVFEDKLLRHIADSRPSDAKDMTTEDLQKLIENEEGF